MKYYFITTIIFAILLLLYIFVVKTTKLQHNSSKLQFIHIPKNAGTTIENVANNNNIKWGKFNSDLRNHTNFKECTYWHTPPKYFNKGSYYDSKDTFCVVRNPYSRIVSEYKYRFGKDKTKLTKKALNEWIQNELVKLVNTNNFKYNCHLIPQYDYIYDNNGNKTCKHILKSENLNDEFNNLMKDYDIDLQLKDEKDNVSSGGLSVKDLDEKSKNIIYEIYKKDFDVLKMKTS